MENKDCPCKKAKCGRHGKCDECRAYHVESKRQRPVACERKRKKRLFTEKEENTYVRIEMRRMLQ